MASAILDETFLRQVSETEGVVDPYSERLESVVDSCPDPNVVPESQQWSRFAAIQTGATLWEPAAFAGEELPFDPTEVVVQVTYFWDRAEGQWDLAWVATWNHDAE